jgi:hypothetical protein
VAKQCAEGKLFQRAVAAAIPSARNSTVAVINRVRILKLYRPHPIAADEAPDSTTRSHEGTVTTRTTLLTIQRNPKFAGSERVMLVRVAGGEDQYHPGDGGPTAQSMVAKLVLMNDTSQGVETN